MQAEDHDLKRLRKLCGNSLWTAAAVFSKEGLKSMSHLILELVRPFFTEHSEEAACLKGEKALAQWYLGAARGDWLTPALRASNFSLAPSPSPRLVLT